jgi:plastocyanin
MTRGTLTRFIRASALGTGVALAIAGAGAASFEIIQQGRAFNQKEITIGVGDTLHFNNNDEFIHQIYVKSDEFNFESAEQPPGEGVDVHFTKEGTFAVRCEIHPKMRLVVTVK